MDYLPQSSQQTYDREKYRFIFPNLKMSPWKHRKVKEFVQSHTLVEPGFKLRYTSLVPRPVFLTHKGYKLIIHSVLATGLGTSASQKPAVGQQGERRKDALPVQWEEGYRTGSSRVPRKPPTPDTPDPGPGRGGTWWLEGRSPVEAWEAGVS